MGCCGRLHDFALFNIMIAVLTISLASLPSSTAPDLGSIPRNYTIFSAPQPRSKLRASPRGSLYDRTATVMSTRFFPATCISKSAMVRSRFTCRETKRVGALASCMRFLDTCSRG